MHESRLGQAFRNLIGNALKYRGKAPPRIQVAAREREGWHVFSISDNGIGIEPHLADQIFRLFKRLHGRDELSGKWGRIGDLRENRGTVSRQNLAGDLGAWPIDFLVFRSLSSVGGNNRFPKKNYCPAEAGL
jgi:hypothetical protein